MNLLEAGALFANMAHAYDKNVQGALDEAGKIIQVEAKRVIGTYEYNWPPLKPETVARKANGDTPLLETGEMRESIERTVQDKSAFVGSNNDKAVWQELGTSRGIPPRSFLMGAAQHKGAEAAHAIASAIFTGLTTGASIGYSHYTGAVPALPALNKP